MRQSDVNELLGYTGDLSIEFEKIKDKAQTDVGIQEIYRPKVKACIEQLRSCLDYIALDIYEFLKRIHPEKIKVVKHVYFPYNKDEVTFKAMAEKNLPGLFLNQSDIYNILEARQSYKCGDAWLLNICELSNELKHDKLLIQEKVATKEVDLFNGAIKVRAQNAVISGNFYNGIVQSKDIIISRGSVISNYTGKEKDFVIKDWTGFIFKEKRIDIIVLISKANIEITKLSNEVYEKIK